jgi:hypothetical protein
MFITEAAIAIYLCGVVYDAGPGVFPGKEVCIAFVSF